jgi:hypothetical protein
MVAVKSPLPSFYTRAMLERRVCPAAGEGHVQHVWHIPSIINRGGRMINQALEVVIDPRRSDADQSWLEDIGTPDEPGLSARR